MCHKKATIWGCECTTTPLIIWLKKRFDKKRVCEIAAPDYGNMSRKMDKQCPGCEKGGSKLSIDTEVNVRKIF